jgi:hypothetical protein
MRFETNGRFWIVEDPGPDSTIADVCWETSLSGLELQFRGGFTTTRRPTLHTDGAEAERDARARLRLRDELEARRGESRG